MTREEIIRLLENADVTVYERPQTRTAQAIEEAIELIKQEPKTEWIPVSERLPERSVWVLAYCKTKDGYEYQTVLLLDKYNGEWTDNDDFCDEVIAWRPLPEPYKAESEAAE